MKQDNNLDRLKDLLAETDSDWENIFREKYPIINYSFFEKLSEDVASLLEFRNSRNIDQLVIDRINFIINAIRFNKEDRILIHHLIISKDRDAFVYTNFDCDKILGILSIGFNSV